jgi:hypothetical protein
LSSRLSPGRLLYLLWHRPKAALARSRREGGPWQQWLDARGRQEMQAAATTLGPWPAPRIDAPEVYFLTGRRFWYQTAFCLHSLRQQGGDVRAVFVDDGSFTDALVEEMQRQFPGSRVLRAADTAAHLDACLPAARYPTLRAQRQTYLHLRKLTDVHAGRRGWRLVLDSDMLFFRRPEALLQWLAAPTRPIHMLDVHDAYGYPAQSLAALTPAPVPEKLNVGICGFFSESIDWDYLEHAATTLIRQHGTSYYLEQALVALLASTTQPQRLPSNDYLLLPAETECRHPTATLHHYVDLSKRGYFRHAWRHVVESQRNNSNSP